MAKAPKGGKGDGKGDGKKKEVDVGIPSDDVVEEDIKARSDINAGAMTQDALRKGGQRGG